jgi:hypothetical protein
VADAGKVPRFILPARPAPWMRESISRTGTECGTIEVEADGFPRPEDDPMEERDCWIEDDDRDPEMALAPGDDEEPME